MEISKLLEQKQPPSWSTIEPSSSSAFEKYTRLRTMAQFNDSTPTTNSSPVTFPSFAWTSFSDPNCTEATTSRTNEETISQNSAANLFFFNGLPHRAAVARPQKKHTSERRPRTTFSIEQTSKLEDEYKRNEYVSRSKRVKLAQTLELTEGQVKIWFQNRRAKDKRIEKAHLDQRVRYFALNVAAMTCPNLLASAAAEISGFETEKQQSDEN